MSFVVRIRGFKMDTRREDIVAFFSDCCIENDVNGVHLTLNRHGELSGEGYVELCTEEDLEIALNQDGLYLGKRYIEVFESCEEELELWTRLQAATVYDPENERFIKMKGLPVSICNDETLRSYINGIADDGVVVLTRLRIAYIHLSSKRLAEKLLRQRLAEIDRTLVTVYPSSCREFQRQWYRVNEEPLPISSTMSRLLGRVSQTRFEKIIDETLKCRKRRRMSIGQVNRTQSQSYAPIDRFESSKRSKRLNDYEMDLFDEDMIIE